ncbi:hypothetical protein K3555_22470 (plasmid) [Leisingera sp. M527]|uniref:hypothetical protein n=1 Tax=Leisingera sp. M527 TaxID=2867014 RepID=UPI0021A5163A|nr:hypothetical protein [Leisingera sp. M527]UWQ35430.1 hypothetical protein K3555_22470 [Leisingera sp. M527]
MKNYVKCLLAGGALALSAIVPQAVTAQGFSATEVQTLYGDGFLLGRNGRNETSRATITIDHLTVRKWGDLFFFVDNFSDGEGSGRKSDQYGEIYLHFSGRNAGLSFGDGLIKDVALGAAINQGTDFTVALIGPRVSFNVPGFRILSLGLYAYDTVTDPFNRDLDTTYQATLVWNRPFEIGNQKFLFKGFTDFIGERGSNVDSQIVFSPQLRWDAGHAMGKKPGVFQVGLEYTHFENKFGVSAADEDSVSVFAAFKF